MSDILNEVFGDSDISSPSEVSSFSKVNAKNKKELHTWLKTVVSALQEQAEQRTRKQRENLLMYRGVSLKKRDIERDRIYRGKRLNRIQKLVIPHIHDLTETRVSQMTRIKPAVEVLPANNEWEDRASAKVVQFIIKHLWYNNNIDFKLQELHRHARIFGESYLFVDYDQSKGDLHPLYAEAQKLGIDKIETADGKSIKIDKPIKTGDVCYDLELPWRVLLQRKTKFDDVEYFFRAKLVQTDSLKEKYNKKNLKSTQDLRMFDIEDMSDKLLEDHTLIFEFWHRGTEDVPEGYKAVFTMDEMLENGDHPYSHKNFPFVRLTDMDVPGSLNGSSKYELISPIYNMYNNINTLIAKNIWLTAHAKWMMPRGAAKIEQLGNDNTVIQYQGPVPPKLAQVQPNPPEVYRYADQLLQQMQVIYGSHGISRGEIPRGITASSALQFLNQLESERASTEIAKHGFVIQDLAKLSIAVAGDKYEVDDGRMVRIVGDQNQHLIRHFDTAHLQKSYDIRFDTSTGLPDTKAGKRQLILDMMQRNPQGNSMDRWEELLEVGNVEKAIDLATAAVKAADSENEDMAAGRPVVGAEIHEDHIVHLQSHYRFVQSRQYKEEMNPEYRRAIQDHIFWTEEAAIEKARTNPTYEAKLAALPLFPMYPHDNYFVPRSLEAQAAEAQGAANMTGELPPGATIPTQELPDLKR